MAINSIDEITCDTSLSSILKSEEIYDELKCIDGSSSIMKNINDRQMTINTNGANGGLTSSIMIDNQYSCYDYALNIVAQYDACGQGFATICQQVGLLSETQEFNELSALKTKVKEKIESIQSNISGLDKESDDYDSKVSDYRHEMTRYDTKLASIEARIGKLNPNITGVSSSSAGSSGSGGNYGPLKVIDTGSDDNNVAYGKDKNIIDDDILNSLRSSDSRDKWVLSKGRIGINGWLSTEGDKYFDCYNKYFTTKVMCKDGVERTVYMICPSSGFGTGDDESLQNNSEPILYITEDALGHKICYDKGGNAISYNGAMNVLEISRNSNASSKGCVCYFDSGAPEIKTKPTPYCPTVNYVQNGNGDQYSWQTSKADANGNKWQEYSTKNFDDSDKWINYDISEKHGNYSVYSKDNGDAGRINVLLTDNDSNTRYYSVKQSDGSYSYYDQFCRPVTEEEVTEYIEHLY